MDVHIRQLSEYKFCIYFQALTSVAYDFYDKVVVMTLNAKQYPWWANNFVPRLYGREIFCKLIIFLSVNPFLIVLD